MDYKKGFNVKPKETNRLGEVTFTDGTYDFPPNQLQCEAYGYKYDKTLGVCSAFKYINKVNTLLNNKTNIVRGGEALVGTVNSFLNGEGNITKGDNRNAFITGQESEIDTGIDNSSVIGGKMGKALRQGEVVLGGGSFSLGAGYTQSSKIQLSGNTINNSATNLKVQNIDGEYITLQTSSIVGYTLYLTRLETGGTSGTAGNYSYRLQRGAIRTNTAGAITITVGVTRNTAKLGVNGSFSIVDSTTTVAGKVTPSVTVQVSDRNNVNNLWSATIYLHELRTNTAF
tara:strand:- start:1265 stop:2119 length:855 start_codon:yes stop_codon:yes gene_type:complete